MIGLIRRWLRRRWFRRQLAEARAGRELITAVSRRLMRTGQTVTNRRLGLPLVGEVTGWVFPGGEFAGLCVGTQSDLGQDFAAWDAAYPEWRAQAVAVIARRPTAAENRDDLWPASSPRGKRRIMWALPVADLEEV